MPTPKLFYVTFGPREIRSPVSIPYSWDDALPYEDYPEGHEHKQERSVTEWLEYIQEQERFKRLAAPLPGQLELPMMGGSDGTAVVGADTDQKSKD